MRASILMMVLVAGCVADAGPDGPQPTITIETERSAVSTSIAPDKDPQVDVCALAAELPAGDVCSLICDPPAMATMLLSEGMRAGACYQLRCVLPGTDAVQVGVCLPP